jgi:hypothetical protein
LESVKACSCSTRLWFLLWCLGFDQFPLWKKNRVARSTFVFEESILNCRRHCLVFIVYLNSHSPKKRPKLGPEMFGVINCRILNFQHRKVCRNAPTWPIQIRQQSNWTYEQTFIPWQSK